MLRVGHSIAGDDGDGIEFDADAIAVDDVEYNFIRDGDGGSDAERERNVIAGVVVDSSADIASSSFLMHTFWFEIVGHGFFFIDLKNWTTHESLRIETSLSITWLSLVSAINVDDVCACEIEAEAIDVNLDFWKFSNSDTEIVDVRLKRSGSCSMTIEKSPNLFERFAEFVPDIFCSNDNLK